MRLAERVKGAGIGRTGWIAGEVEAPVERILDIGCAFGWALGELRGTAQELWGVDLDDAALSRARTEYPDVHFVLKPATELPFAADSFDVVILSEVIEHVADSDKPRVVDEAHRVLKPEGLLLFTAPYAGLLAWADPLDLKRRLPRLYSLYSRASGYTPATAAETGHKHLSTDEICRLLDRGFRIESIRYCGMLMPFLTWLLVLGERLHVLPRRSRGTLNRFRAWESGVRYPRRVAFNVRLRARKHATANGSNG